MPPAQRAQVDVMAVIAQHHRHAGQTAFRCLTLPYIGNRPAADQITHCDSFVALMIGHGHSAPGPAAIE